MTDIQCPRCGKTVALADADESTAAAAARNHDRFCHTPPVERKPVMSAPALHSVPAPGKRPHPRDLVAHDDPKIARAAARVMDAVKALDAAWEAHAAKAGLRERQRELEAELAEVKAQLRGQPTKPAAHDWKTVRAWAADNGLDCPATGKVPNAVVDAYDQAHP